MLLLRARYVIGLALVLITTAPLAGPTLVGVSFLSDVGQPTDRPLELSLWYPTEAAGPARLIGENAVFTGTDGIVDAPPTPGVKDLVLISHGGLRSAANSGAWLAQRLAKEGFIAAEINAPRPATPKKAANEIWQRPADISRALDALLAHPVWSQLVNEDSIASIGFYLGGTASLLLSETAFDEKALRSTCDDGRENPDCDWFKANNISLIEPDLKPMPANLRDSRIAHHFAIEPEYLHAFSIDKITEPQSHSSVMFLNKERDGIATNVEARNYFDGFGLCKAQGASIIAEDGGDARICGDSEMERRRIHDEIVAWVLDRL